MPVAIAERRSPVAIAAQVDGAQPGGSGRGIDRAGSGVASFLRRRGLGKGFQSVKAPETSAQISPFPGGQPDGSVAGSVTVSVEEGLGSYTVAGKNVETPDSLVDTGMQSPRRSRRTGKLASLTAFGVFSLAACSIDSSGKSSAPAASEIASAPTTEVAPQIPTELQVTREMREVTEPGLIREQISGFQTLLKSAFVDPAEGVTNDPEFWSAIDGLSDTADSELGTRLKVYVKTSRDIATGEIDNWVYTYNYWEQPTNESDGFKPIPDVEVRINLNVGSPAYVDIRTHMSPDGTYSGFEFTERTNDPSVLLTNASRIIGIPESDFTPEVNTDGSVYQTFSFGPDRNSLKGNIYAGGPVTVSMIGGPGTEQTIVIPDDSQSVVIVNNDAFLAGDIVNGYQDGEYKRQLLEAITDPALASQVAFSLDLTAADDVVNDARSARTPEEFAEIEGAIDAIPNPDARQKAEVGVDAAQAYEAVDAADSGYSPEAFVRARAIAGQVEDPPLRDRTRALIDQAEQLGTEQSIEFDDARYALSDHADDVRYDLSDEASRVKSDIDKIVYPPLYE